MQVARFLVEAVVSRTGDVPQGPSDGRSGEGSSDLSPEGRTQVETGSATPMLEPCLSNTRFTSLIR